MRSNFKPEYLLIPYPLIEANIPPAAMMVFAAIYWFENMKKGCFASNKTLSEIAKVDVRTVGKAISLLERNGFIKRIYLDEKRRKRAGIKVLIKIKNKSKKQDSLPSDETIEEIVEEMKRDQEKALTALPAWGHTAYYMGAGRPTEQ